MKSKFVQVAKDVINIQADSEPSKAEVDEEPLHCSWIIEKRAVFGSEKPSGEQFQNGYRIGEEGEKKKWILGENQRIFQRLLKKHQQFIDPKGGDGKKKQNAAEYENSIRPPIRLSRDHDDQPLIKEIAPGPLPP